MPPAPTVPADLIKQVLSATDEQGRRPGSTEAAEILSQMLNKQIKPTLIRAAIHRHPEWNLPPVARKVAPKTMDYRCERVLGDVPYAFKRSWTWYAMTAVERVGAGLLMADSPLAVRAADHIDRLKAYGRIVVVGNDGLETRPALPWELGDYLPAPEPADGVTQVQTLLLQGRVEAIPVDGRDWGVTEEHRTYWAHWALERM
jgi:hypothetical protein